MDHRDINVKRSGTGGNGNHHGLRTKTNHVTANAITPHAIGEEAEAVEQLKKAVKNKEISEDDEKSGVNEIDKLTHAYVKRVDDTLALKEKEIMTV